MLTWGSPGIVVVEFHMVERSRLMLTWGSKGLTLSDPTAVGKYRINFYSIIVSLYIWSMTHLLAWSCKVCRVGCARRRYYY